MHIICTSTIFIIVDFFNGGMFKMDVEHLSYTIRKKTEKIFDLKKELDNSKKWLIPSTGLTGLFTCYIVLFSQRYVNYTIATFSPWDKLSSSFLNIDIAIILLLACSCLFMYKSFLRYNKAKASYEAFRKDLIKSIDADFCNCSPSEGCKDVYIESMEEHGINLVF